MRIYTGYYGALKFYREKGLFPVAISLSVPHWIGGGIPNYKPLNPKGWMLKLDRPEYTEAYNETILGNVVYEDFLDWLDKVSEGKDVVLLCFEKPSDFCHRQLVAEWLNIYCPAFEVSEFLKESNKPKLTQPELF